MNLNQENDQSLPRASAVPWPPLLLVGAVAAAYAMQRLYPLAWPGLDDAPARFVGLGLGIVGLLLVIWGVATLRQHNTTYRPDRASDALVTSGPFRLFRNPIYLGDALMLLGLAEVTKNLWFLAAAVVFAILVSVLQILPEEKYLEARFGNEYRSYKERTRRWI